MISFDKLWLTMEKKNISQYQLIQEFGFSTSLLYRLRNNTIVKTSTLNRLCEILDCELQDIAEYKKD